MYRFDNRSETEHRSAIVWLALLGLPLCGCPFSDNYAVDGPDGGGDATGGATSTSTAAGGTFLCGPTEAPPGGACPAECSSCNGAICIIECGMGPESCEGQMLTCPAGFACELNCALKDACKDASLSCPSGFDCHVICEEKDACKNLDIVCNDGNCSVSCLATDACKEATFACGEGDTCSCDGFARSLQTTGCESACSCTGCE